jgi:3-hydroxyacyl-[acyl-carrier-protein] dehydratase
MTRRDIEAILPHREPFVWVDRVTEIVPGQSCHAETDVDPGAPFFAGHFPGDPILPGVFLIEAAAQTAGLMLGAATHDTEGPHRHRLAAVSQFKFPKAVLPGATIHIFTTTLIERDGMAVVSATLVVDGETVATGQLTVVSR